MPHAAQFRHGSRRRRRDAHRVPAGRERAGPGHAPRCADRQPHVAVDAPRPRPRPHRHRVGRAGFRGVVRHRRRLAGAAVRRRVGGLRRGARPRAATRRRPLVRHDGRVVAVPAPSGGACEPGAHRRLRGLGGFVAAGRGGPTAHDVPRDGRTGRRVRPEVLPRPVHRPHSARPCGRAGRDDAGEHPPAVRSSSRPHRRGDRPAARAAHRRRADARPARRGRRPFAARQRRGAPRCDLDVPARRAARARPRLRRGGPRDGVPPRSAGS